MKPIYAAFILLSYMLIPVQSIAQVKAKVSGINLIIAPELDFVKTRSDFEDLNNFNNEFKAPAFGYNAGVTLNYNLSTKWILQTGVIFNERGYANKKCPVCWPGPYPNCKTIVLVKNASTTHTSIQGARGYLYIPLNFEYMVKQSRTSYSLFSGATLEVLFFDRYRATEYDSLGNQQSYTQYKRIHNGYNWLGSSFVLGGTIKRGISEKTALSAGPFARISTPFVYNKIGYSFLYAFGINLSLEYKL